jgi:hypothetical protein
MLKAQDLQNWLIHSVLEELCTWRKLLTTLFIGRVAKYIALYPAEVAVGAIILF